MRVLLLMLILGVALTTAAPMKGKRAHRGRGTHQANGKGWKPMFSIDDLIAQLPSNLPELIPENKPEVPPFEVPEIPEILPFEVPEIPSSEGPNFPSFDGPEFPALPEEVQSAVEEILLGVGFAQEHLDAAFPELFRELHEEDVRQLVEKGKKKLGSDQSIEELKNNLDKMVDDVMKSFPAGEKITSQKVVRRLRDKAARSTDKRQSEILSWLMDALGDMFNMDWLDLSGLNLKELIGWLMDLLFSGGGSSAPEGGNEKKRLFLVSSEELDEGFQVNATWILPALSEWFAKLKNESNGHWWDIFRHGKEVEHWAEKMKKRLASDPLNEEVVANLKKMLEDVVKSFPKGEEITTKKVIRGLREKAARSTDKRQSDLMSWLLDKIMELLDGWLDLDWLDLSNLDPLALIGWLMDLLSGSGSSLIAFGDKRGLQDPYNEAEAESERRYGVPSEELDEGFQLDASWLLPELSEWFAKHMNGSSSSSSSSEENDDWWNLFRKASEKSRGKEALNKRWPSLSLSDLLPLLGGDLSVLLPDPMWQIPEIPNVNIPNIPVVSPVMDGIMFEADNLQDSLNEWLDELSFNPGRRGANHKAKKEKKRSSQKAGEEDNEYGRLTGVPALDFGPFLEGLEASFDKMVDGVIKSFPKGEEITSKKVARGLRDMVARSTAKRQEDLFTQLLGAVLAQWDDIVAAVDGWFEGGPNTWFGFSGEVTDRASRGQLDVQSKSFRHLADNWDALTEYLENHPDADMINRRLKKHLLRVSAKRTWDWWEEITESASEQWSYVEELLDEMEEAFDEALDGAMDWVGWGSNSTSSEEGNSTSSEERTYSFSRSSEDSSSKSSGKSSSSSSSEGSSKSSKESSSSSSEEGDDDDETTTAAADTATTTTATATATTTTTATATTTTTATATTTAEAATSEATTASETEATTTVNMATTTTTETEATTTANMATKLLRAMLQQRFRKHKN